MSSFKNMVHGGHVGFSDEEDHNSLGRPHNSLMPSVTKILLLATPKQPLLFSIINAEDLHSNSPINIDMSKFPHMPLEFKDDDTLESLEGAMNHQDAASNPILLSPDIQRIEQVDGRRQSVSILLAADTI